MSYPTEEQIHEWCRNAPAAGPERDALIARRAVDLTRAALSADGPAVPEGREPASVMGEPSDVWYTYCPEGGVELYSSEEQARSAAESIMGFYENAACSDGWHEDMESVSWGTLNPIERAQVVERRKSEPGSGFDEWVKYELRPAHALPLPAGEVQP